MRRGDEIAAAARALVGVPFRPQGRDPAFGLDCVGLAAAATGAPAPTSRPQRGGSIAAAAALFGAAGLHAVDSATPRPGDLLLARAGLRQLHLVVTTDSGFVHADAALGRVTEVPGDPPWPVLGIWRCF